MEYTIDKLARLAGVSPRTLRYYDQIGLLRPARLSSSGYRIYGQAEVDRLQQILFYRELGIELAKIGQIVNSSDFNPMSALYSQLEALEARKAQTEKLIAILHKTIEKEKGIITMTDKEKFEGFKTKMIEENEEKYGREIREKYGEETVRASNAKMMNLTQEQYDEMQKIAGEITQKIEDAVRAGISGESETGREVAQLHKDWLSYTWTTYTPEAHRGLAEMYVQDERFTAYYDKNIEGCAVFMRDAICHWIK